MTGQVVWTSMATTARGQRAGDPHGLHAYVHPAGALAGPSYAIFRRTEKIAAGILLSSQTVEDAKEHAAARLEQIAEALAADVEPLAAMIKYSPTTAAARMTEVLSPTDITRLAQALLATRSEVA